MLNMLYTGAPLGRILRGQVSPPPRRAKYSDMCDTFFLFLQFCNLFFLIHKFNLIVISIKCIIDFRLTEILVRKMGRETHTPPPLPNYEYPYPYIYLRSQTQYPSYFIKAQTQSLSF